MIPLFPFIYESEKTRKKEKVEQLYIEIEPPLVEKKDQEADETPRVIIIDL